VILVLAEYSILAYIALVFAFAMLATKQGFIHQLKMEGG
jgi:hypothetical protein